MIADVWDNPGGGVAGDSTWFIHECLARGTPGVAVGTIWDPQAAALCHAAGEGAALQVSQSVCWLDGLNWLIVTSLILTRLSISCLILSLVFSRDCRTKTVHIRHTHG